MPVSQPRDLPCFTATEEYSPLGEYKQMYGNLKAPVVQMTPEQLADREKRLQKLYARLDEIFASEEVQTHLKMFKR